MPTILHRSAVAVAAAGSLSTAAVAAAFLALPALAAAQQVRPVATQPAVAPAATRVPAPDSTLATASLRAVTITATRVETDVLRVAAPVTVINQARIATELPNSAADLLRNEPGVDVIGTGVNQGRPAIRGQRGQRILLLEDGIRLNNSRRQQDFGELPALVDPAQLSRVEVVRGPASVLYGTDAIGGVVNLITRSPRANGTDHMSGRLGWQYGSQGTLSKTTAGVSGSTGGFAYALDGSARVAGDYDAPAGTYGKVHLASDTPLQYSGVRDRNVTAALSWTASGGHHLFGRFEQYTADDAGFGYIPPAAIGADPTTIEIRYPHQEFGKFTFGFRSGSLGWGAADRVDVTAYTQRNTRDLAQHIFAPFGPGTPPGAGVDISTMNFTNIGTSGFRAEATKATSKVIFTYGADLYSDDAKGTDSSKTTVVGFGPPQSQYSNRPQIPNATLTSYGAFVQGDIRFSDAFSLVVGTRGQSTASEPKATPGRTDVLGNHNSSTAVYAANAVWRASDEFSLVATLGSGFRSPNLVERYFDGPTPEGSAYQRATPDLRPEQSVNLDGGVKYRGGRVTAEVSAYRNDIRDAIVIAKTTEKVGRLPVYQNVNVGKLRATGVEAAGEILLDNGFSLAVNYSTLKSTNISAPDSPIGDSYASKLNAALRWTSSGGRWWGEYAVRRNGEQKDIAAGASPVGDVLPAFTVQNVRAGIRAWQLGGLRQDITLGVNNLGNALYAEAANASFFRPEPGRSFVLGVTTTF